MGRATGSSRRWYCYRRLSLHRVRIAATRQAVAAEVLDAAEELTGHRVLDRSNGGIGERLVEAAARAGRGAIVDLRPRRRVRAVVVERQHNPAGRIRRRHEANVLV